MDVAGTGFTVLDRLYANGDLEEEALGGSCGNVLVSLAMLHRFVAPVLALGDDNTGNRLVDEFSDAGANIRYITRRANFRSPVLAQKLDKASGLHDFSFVCPETYEDLPRYQPIDESDFMFALPVLTNCSIFYADRISNNILKAMRAAQSAGAVIFFEPSNLDHSDLFDEALRLTSILKYSEERLGERLANRLPECVRIVTHGAAGLEICDPTEAISCEAINAPIVLDTCGSGDMVSVGLIDWMLTKEFGANNLKASDLLEGIGAGQHLAAENCAYPGARGLFKKRGANYVREILNVHISKL